MKNKSYFALALLVSCTLSLPIDSTIDESLNNIDHGDVQDRKNPSENAETIELKNKKSTTASLHKNSVIPTTTSSTISECVAPKCQISWFLSPLVQKWQLSPKPFFQERVEQLRNALINLGFSAQQQNSTGKQFSNSLLHLVGVTDPDYYTNRLDPAGFFKGNGWFANKGGLLGAPGAIFSTGSLLTDYPTAYKKK